MFGMNLMRFINEGEKMKICDRCGSDKEVRSGNPWFGGKDLCTECFLEFRTVANKWFANKLKICRREPRLVFEEVKE